MKEITVEECSERLWQVHIDVSGFYYDYARSVGLTLASMKVLTILYKEKSCTQKYIIQLTYLPKQTVNAIIKGLYEQGFIKEITESSLDKRNRVIALTVKGREYADEIISKARDAEYRALEKIGLKRRTALLEAIELYRKNLSIE